MKQAIKEFFFPSVDGVLAQFDKTLTRLGRVQARNVTAAANLDKAAEILADRARKSRIEAARAASVQSKIANLIA